MVAGLVFDASHAWFWQHAHDTALVSAALILVLLSLLLLRRRFAWWVFVVFSGVGLVSWLAYVSSHVITSAWLVGGIAGLVEFGLLVSAPMRRFVRLSGRPEPSPS